MDVTVKFIEEQNRSKGMARMDQVAVRRRVMQIGVLSVALSQALAAGAATTVVSKQIFDYDDQGRLTAVRGNNGQSERRTYDDEGRVTSITNALNHKTTFTHNALGQVIGQVDARNGTSSYSYDSNGNVVQVVDPRGKVTRYERDGFGQVWSQQSPDTGLTASEYNAAGLPTRLSRNDGSVTTISYDGLGRQTVIKAGTSERRFAYDACSNGKGRLCQTAVIENAVINGSSVSALAVSDTSYTYTPHGWLLSRTEGGVDGNGVEFEDRTAFTYDGMGRPAVVAYPNGLEVRYGYATGWLTTVNTTINGSTKTIARNIEYAPDGNLVAWDHGNGLTTRVSRDLDQRVVGLSAASGATVVQSLTYGYDKANRITAITDGVETGQSRQYGYDALARLTSETSLAQRWGYDASGNRTSEGGPSGAATYSIDPYSNRINTMQQGGRTSSFGYDALGNMTTETVAGARRATYAYDGFNRMRSAEVDGVTGRYTYNALGARASKAVGTDVTRFMHGRGSQLWGERTESGWTNYIWLGNTLLAAVKPDQRLYFVHSDHLGRPSAVTSSTKQVVWRAANEAWGSTVSVDNFGGLNIGLPGQYLDDESGLWSNGFRDGYDARLGRYTQPDPIGLGGGSFSTYAYADGSPINMVDPFGLAGNPLAGYNPALGPIIVKTPTTAIPFLEKVVVSFVVGKLSADFLTINKFGQIIPKVVGVAGRLNTISMLLMPSDIACAEIDCDKNGIPDYIERANPVVMSPVPSWFYDAPIPPIEDASIGLGQVDVGPIEEVAQPVVPPSKGRGGGSFVGGSGGSIIGGSVTVGDVKPAGNKKNEK